MSHRIHSPVPKVAAIHDLSGFGRASLTIAIPTLSAMGIQVCPLPTAVLSSQTSGIDDYTFFDLTDQIAPMMDHWKRLNLCFDSVYSGFLGSARQVELVERCHNELLQADGIFIVDPVLGDEGEYYMEQMSEITEGMKHLVALADVVTPNLTECCLLLGEEYKTNVSDEELKDYLMRLAQLRPSESAQRKGTKQSLDRRPFPKTVLITSAPCQSAEKTSSKDFTGKEDDFVRVVAYESASESFWQVKTPKINAFYPGTGDTFTSVFLGSLLKKDSVPLAMSRAAHFVYQAILLTHGYHLPSYEGIMLEKMLPNLAENKIYPYEAF